MGTVYNVTSSCNKLECNMGEKLQHDVTFQ